MNVQSMKAGILFYHSIFSDPMRVSHVLMFLNLLETRIPSFDHDECVLYIIEHIK